LSRVLVMNRKPSGVDSGARVKETRWSVPCTRRMPTTESGVQLGQLPGHGRRVGQSDAPMVEQHNARADGQPADQVFERRLLPDHLEVAGQRRPARGRDCADPLTADPLPGKPIQVHVGTIVRSEQSVQGTASLPRWTVRLLCVPPARWPVPLSPKRIGLRAVERPRLLAWARLSFCTARWPGSTD
jgi:hypothetical protein